MQVRLGEPRRQESVADVARSPCRGLGVAGRRLGAAAGDRRRRGPVRGTWGRGRRREPVAARPGSGAGRLPGRDGRAATGAAATGGGLDLRAGSGLGLRPGLGARRGSGGGERGGRRQRARWRAPRPGWVARGSARRRGRRGSAAPEAGAPRPSPAGARREPVRRAPARFPAEGRRRGGRARAATPRSGMSRCGSAGPFRPATNQYPAARTTRSTATTATPTWSGEKRGGGKCDHPRGPSGVRGSRRRSWRGLRRRLGGAPRPEPGEAREALRRAAAEPARGRRAPGRRRGGAAAAPRS